MFGQAISAYELYRDIPNITHFWEFRVLHIWWLLGVIFQKYDSNRRNGM